MPEKLTVTPKTLFDLQQFEPDSEIRTDYSGRGMYGRTCVGYVGSDVIMFAFRLAVTLAEQINDPAELFDVEDMLERMGDPSTDSMGYSTIYYWPNITVTGTEDED